MLPPANHNEKDNFINLYSHSFWQLGRWMSNFAELEVNLREGVFKSIEGYWYWLSIPDSCPEKDKLKDLADFAAKKLGRRLREEYGTNILPEDFTEEVEKAFRAKIKYAIWVKIETYPDLKKLLVESTLPFYHFYVKANGERKDAGFEWITEIWENARIYYKGLGVTPIQNQEEAKPMIKLMICGSIQATGIMLEYARKVVAKAKATDGIEIIVGDAFGVDQAVAFACQDADVPYMAYGTGTKARNGARNYTQISKIEAGFNGYTSRDRLLVRMADKVMCIWNGNSRGTKAVHNYAIELKKTVWLQQPKQIPQPMEAKS